MNTPRQNLLDDLPVSLAHERFDLILERAGVRLERIVSLGQSTPAGEWLTQAHGEWVLLLKGAAGLSFEDEAEIALKPGDSVWIAAGRFHRVNWTVAGESTVWLALHLA
jgi:cupin 2 domain-containing protein